MANWQDILKSENKWIDALKEEIKSLDYNNINFLNIYYDIIPGDTRKQKRDRVSKLAKKLITNYTTKKEVVTENFDLFSEAVKGTSTEENKVIRFGLISDTHINSKYTQLTYLKQFYSLCNDLGIHTVYHGGDIDDGENMRPGHAYENYNQGADEHIEHIVKVYPKYDNINTYFILGNHDASFRKHCGLDIGKQIESKRPDMHYLGRDIANIDIGYGIKLCLRHPWTGSAYALSYRPQKIVEAYESACTDKPDILAIGHFHKLEYLYYHNVHVLQTGSFQMATPFMIGKGISAAMGGWIVEVHLDDENLIDYIVPRAVTYQNPIIEDYKKYI